MWQDLLQSVLNIFFCIFSLLLLLYPLLCLLVFTVSTINFVVYYYSNL